MNEKDGVGLWGLVMSLVGTVYLALSTFEYSGSYIETSDFRQFNPLFLDPILFKLSIYTIIIGFVWQIMDRFWDRISIRYRWCLLYIVQWFSLIFIFYMVLYRVTGKY